MVILTSLQTMNRGESQAERNPPHTVIKTGHRKASLLRPETKASKELSPWSDIPTPGPVS